MSSAPFVMIAWISFTRSMFYILASLNASLNIFFSKYTLIALS